MSDHPRWPYDMAIDVRLVIGDEVDSTWAAFPAPNSMADKPRAISMFAEALDGFIPEDIREGFRLARQRSTRYAPVPTVVRDCTAEARRIRLARERRDTPERPLPGPLAPEEIPDWRSQLRAATERSTLTVPIGVGTRERAEHDPVAPPPGVRSCKHHADCAVADNMAHLRGEPEPVHET